MIIDRLENAHYYENMYPGFAEAFEFLRHGMKKHPELGRHDIVGDRVYAIVADSLGHGKDKARLEVHRKYIDIQFITGGSEVFGWSPLQACAQESEPFREGDDLGFFADKPESWFAAPVGTFAVFFPEDAHAPLCGEGQIKKIVIKVAVKSE